MVVQGTGTLQGIRADRCQTLGILAPTSCPSFDAPFARQSKSFVSACQSCKLHLWRLPTCKQHNEGLIRAY